MSKKMGRKSKKQTDDCKDLEVIYEYVSTEDAEERIQRIYEILLFEMNDDPSIRTKPPG